MSKDNKNDNSVSEKFRRFLKIDKKGTPVERKEFVISDDVKQQLGPNSPYISRIQTSKEILDKLQNLKLEKDGIGKIWHLVKDFLEPSTNVHHRSSITRFLIEVINISELDEQSRSIFFQYIVHNYQTENIKLFLDFLNAILNNGKNIEGVESSIQEFVVEWVPFMIKNYPEPSRVFQFLTNLVKHNSAYFNKDDFMSFLVVYGCRNILQGVSEEEVQSCFCFLETVISFSYIPADKMDMVIRTLSRLASVPDLMDVIWKVLKKYLYTGAANTIINCMTTIIESEQDPQIVGGCIILLTNAIWAKTSCSDISLSYSSVLQTMDKASLSANAAVVFETSIGIRKLLINKKVEVYKHAWTNIMDVLTHLYFSAAHINSADVGLHNVLKDILAELETVVSNGHISDDLTTYYDLPECVCCPRPVPYVLRLLDYKVPALKPEPKWMCALISLTHKYFVQESRQTIRLHMLLKLKFLFEKYKKTHGKILCEELFNTQLILIEQDKDVLIRQKTVAFLVEVVLQMDTGRVLENILYFIHKIVLSPYTNLPVEGVDFTWSAEAGDVMEGVDGLILIFKKKIWQWPTNYAIQAYQSLMMLLENHYRYPLVLKNHPIIRTKVLELIFEMRANENYNLGFPNCPEAGIPFNPVSKDLDREIGKYTPYIIVDHKHGQKPKVPMPDRPLSSLEDENHDESPVAHEDDEHTEEQIDYDASEGGDNVPLEPVHLSLTKAAQIVLVALKKEDDWPIVEMMLDKLPTVLENKALILSKDGNDIDYLATILCTLISETRSDFSQRYRKTPEKFTVSDFNACIYPVLAKLASYHEDMGPAHQRDIIKILQFGILSKSSPLCVSAMTTCVLEMRTTMVRHLRDMMLSLSKISATVHNAHPSLEFLSTLLHLPRVYSDFSPDQYMSVFAICIPYTNPFKFNHYIVSLAYHVIAMWFLKCRLSYRKQFVNFIAKNLNTILVQESSDRARLSGSEQQSKEDMVQFHRDLRETLVDFMARYCFDSYSPTTHRTPVAEMLVDGGQKQMWLLGTRIITVTTSGCSQRPLIRGVCDKCYQACGNDKDSTPVESFSQAEEVGLRRRHKSEFHRSVSHEVKNAPQSKDDLHVENQSGNAPRYMSFLSQDGSRDGTGRNLSDEGLQTFQSDPSFSPNVRSEIKQRLCACWCRGWAEILIRQPTGDVSWMMRIQNEQTLVSEGELLPVSDLSNLFYNYEESFMAMYQGGGLQGATSADSDLASESGLTTAQSNEWSGSALSSGNNSRTSSELKLNQDSEKPSESHSAVSYSLSDPEVNLKLAEGDAQSEQTSDKNLDQVELDPQGNPKPRLRSASSAVGRSSSIVGCPSPSAAPFSGIRHASAAQMKSSTAVASGERDDEEADDPSLQPMKRGRGHAISEMNPASRASKKPIHRRPTLAHTGSLSASVAGSSDSMFSLPAETSATTSSDSSGKKAAIRGISPSAVFLQLYYQGNFGGGWMRPIFLPTHNTDIERSIKLLDLIKPQENHKIAVLYVAPNQRTELEILKNSWGSARYLKFLGGLGEVYNMKDLPADTYLGGYDRTGVDGDVVYMWNDQIMQVVFHVATILPNSDNDEQCINKKRHIGNDYVTIVYNDSKYPYQLDTIKSHFNHSIVEIIPTDHMTNLVITHCKPEVGDLFSWKPTNNSRMVSDISLPVLARQLAVHANLASMVSESLKDTSRSPYSSNWLERLRRIRKLREKVIGSQEAQKQVQEQQSNLSEGGNQCLDFSDIIDVERLDNKERGRNRLFSRR